VSGTSLPPHEPSDTPFELRRPKALLAELLLPPEVSERLDQAIALYANRDLIFDTWGLKALVRTKQRMVLNFFGPSGTGKTHCAEGFAERLGLDYLSINYATMESKFVGETAKNIAKAFRFASQRRVLMHWDEADTILGRRLTNVSQSADHAVNTARTTMLLELERHDGPVVFSTNLVTNYDNAFERRIDAFIEFRVPSAPERLALLHAMMPPPLPRSSGLSLDAVAEATEGFSPADLRKLFLLGAARMVLKATNRALTTEILLAAVEDVRHGKVALIGRVDAAALAPGADAPESS
jgi:SpoVK/Ycf46/Vps4 family AAA+-type ATPase